MSQFLDQSEVNEVLENNYIGRLACCKDNTPYLIPITYCFDKTDNSIIGYTAYGKKLHILRRNPIVCFEVDEIISLSQWKTVVATGEFIEMEGIDARNALHFFVEKIRILSKNNPNERQIQFLKDMTHAETHFSGSVIYRVKLKEKTGRYER